MAFDVWCSFVQVIENCFGNYKEISGIVLSNFNIISCNMSIKVHYLHSHSDRFLKHLGAIIFTYSKEVVS